MAGNPAEPPPSERRSRVDGQADDERARGGGREPPDERSGPVAVARHVKDDGRALILYTRNERART
jgi:hypothetical protein